MVGTFTEEKTDRQQSLFEDRAENYYRANMTDGDNPPVGILLCTKAGQKMVHYISPGIDENIFMSTHMLHLHDREKIFDWQHTYNLIELHCRPEDEIILYSPFQIP